MAKKSRKSSKASKAKRTAKKTTTRPPRRTAAKKAKRSASARAAKTRRAGAKTAKKAKRAVKKTRPAAKAPARAAKSPAAKQARKAAQARTAAATGKRPNLDRERRVIREEEELVPSPPSSLDMDRSASSVRSGRAEYYQKLREHTSTGPAMTGGDVDADWEDAEAVGDEAPGGDNPTPDQDVVDEIGRAMGIEYDDNEELQGGDELAERDRHRWELDPASREDFEDE